MITLASDCLLFQTSNGESVPFSAEMISVELTGDDYGFLDVEFVKHAANAVFHYFKHDLGRITVTVGEFAGALEKVLRGFGMTSETKEKTLGEPHVLKSDLRQLACESGKGCELFFFPRLRDQMRQHLQQSPQILHFRGLRGCVKQLTGAKRWSPRCQSLHNQIVEFLRNCLSTGEKPTNCTLLVE
jgi:hypothetical protein